MVGMQQVSRRRFITTAATAAGAMAVAACGGLGGGSDAAKSKGPVKLSFLTNWTGGVKSEIMDQALAEFRRQNPEITLEPEFKNENMLAQFTARVASGTLPDASLGPGAFFGDAIDKKIVLDVTPVLKKLRVNTSDYTILPAYSGAIELNGKFYGLPFELNTRHFFFNKTIFEKQGLKTPANDWTWNDLLDTTKALTKPEQEQWGFSIIDDSAIEAVYGMFAMSNSAPPEDHTVSEDYKKTLLDRPAAMEGVQFVLDLLHRHHVAPTVAERQGLNTANLFLQQKVGIINNSFGIVTQLDAAKPNFQWELCHLPLAPKTAQAKSLHVRSGALGDGHGRRQGGRGGAVARLPGQRVHARVGGREAGERPGAQEAPDQRAFPRRDTFHDEGHPGNHPLPHRPSRQPTLHGVARRRDLGNGAGDCRNEERSRLTARGDPTRRRGARRRGTVNSSGRRKQTSANTAFLSEGTSVAKQHTTRRRIITTTMAATGAASVSACGGAASDSATTASKDPVKVSFLTNWTGGARTEILDQALAEFARQYPQITVEAEIKNENILAQVTARVASDTMPDTTLGPNAFFGDAVGRKFVLDITGVLKKLRINTDDYTTLPAYSGGTELNGKWYGLPFQLNTRHLFYNKTMFEKQGIKTPATDWTWNDLLDTTKALTNAAQEQWGYCIIDDSAVEAVYGMFAMSNSTAPDDHTVTEDFKKTLLDRPAAIEGVQFVLDLLHRHHVAPTVEERKGVSQANLFLQQKVGIVNGSIGMISDFNAAKPNFQWELAHIPLSPKTRKRKAFMAAQPHWVTSKSAGKEEQAVQLLAFLAGEYTQGLVADKRGHTPVLKKLQASPRYLVTPPSTMKVVSETIPYLTDQRIHPRYTEWRAAVTMAMAPAIAGTRSVPDSLREATRLGDVALAGSGQ